MTLQLTEHRRPAVVETVDPAVWSGMPTAPTGSVNDPALVRAAGHATRLLPPAIHDALVDFADCPDDSGALLLRGVPVGALPHTPATPTSPVEKCRTSEFHLLSAARRLGQPVGYLPEHGGDLVQNIVPVATNATRQVSTSSRVELMFHTEAAFHPHRPRYLLLLCLRGDPSAVTSLASIREVAPLLDAKTRDTLFEPRFRTAVDESYLAGGANHLGAPMAVLSGDPASPHLVFDADLMVGTDSTADEALRDLADAVAGYQTGVALEAGDLLVVDNTIAVHGRSPFTPRFDGFDRWLQRTFVVSDLSPSAGERSGRIISTRF